MQIRKKSSIAFINKKMDQFVCILLFHVPKHGRVANNEILASPPSGKLETCKVVFKLVSFHGILLSLFLKTKGLEDNDGDAYDNFVFLKRQAAEHYL